MQRGNIKLQWMNTITITIVFILSFQVSFAQLTKAEIDKTMKQVQDMMKKYANDTSKVKALQNLLDQQKKMTDVMKNQPQNNNSVANKSLYADPSDYGNVDNWKFPARNSVMLSSLPKKILTRSELVSFLNDIYMQLAKKLSPGVGSSVQSITEKYNNDENKMGGAAVTGWYTNYREESLLLIIKAAANSPDNGLLLNNCAAILNMSGIEQTAIPILKYLLQSFPGNSMVLNNLGQAYAGLGETDTAMVYLGRCLKIESKNVEANNTAGQIEAIKGNTGKAIEYFEKSITGGYNKTAELKLGKIKKESNIYPFVKPRVKIPEYFNQFKYTLPAQCTKVANASQAEAEFIAFRKTVANQAGVYQNKITALQTTLADIMQKKMDQQNMGNPSVPAFRKDDFVAHPFHELCGIMLTKVREDNEKEIHDIIGVDKKYYSDREAIENEYKDLLQALKKDFAEKEDKCCGKGKTACSCPTSEEKCIAYTGLADKYLPKFAVLTEDWQEKNRLAFRKYFDDLVYWSYLGIHPNPYGDAHFHLVFYELVSNYLTMLLKIGETKIVLPCDFAPTTATSDSNEIKEIECPFEIAVPFIVGNFEMSCEKISLSGGEGALFSYEKNFKTKQSTLSVGIGAKIWETKAEFGPVEGKAGIGASESIFITFDGNNKIADAGLKFSASAGAGLEVGAEKEIVTDKSVKATKELAKEGTGVGYILGINSGWNFNEGPFKGMIGPAPEVQVNKNVNTNKPSNR